MKSKPTPFGVPKRLDPPPRVEGVWAPEGYRLVGAGAVVYGDMIHLSGAWTEVLLDEIGVPVGCIQAPIARRISPRVSTAREASQQQIADEMDAETTRSYADASAAQPIVTFRNVTFVGNPSTDDYYAPFDWPDTAATPRIEVPRRIAKPKNAPLTEAQRAIAFPGPRKMIKLT